MSRRKEMFEGKSLDHVADVMSGCQPGSDNDQMAKAEFLLRQAKYQEEGTDAAKETATYTKKYTRYMFWSVVILALSALGTFLISLMGYFRK